MHDIVKPRILIMAGGTGGHVFPAEQLAKQVKLHNMQPIWIGRKNSLEDRVCQQYKIHKVAINVSAFRGRSGKIFAFLKLIIATFKLLFIFLYKKLGPLSFAANISIFSDKICPATTALPPVTLSNFNFGASSINLYSCKL